MAKALTILGLLIGLLIPPLGAQAAQLVMVDSRGCPYCARFNRDIGRVFDSTPAAKSLDLRKVSRRGWPKDLRGVSPAYVAPTFIVVENGREIGRFAGYRNAELFWKRLQPLLAKL